MIDLEATTLGTIYGFESDRYGERSGNPYINRLPLVDLVKELNTPSFRKGNKYGSANETMIRDYISPHLIRRIVVQFQDDKDLIIKQLIQDNLLINKAGVWYIGEKKIDDFIIVSQKFEPEMWSD